LRSTLGWLCKSQDITGCGGFSRAYSLNDGWGPAYPETTGYITQTFLECAERFPDLGLIDRARRAGEWLADIQLDSGAICRLMYHPTNIHPSVFNTGMVLHGWISLAEREHSARIFRAAERAVNWLVAEQEEAGYWVRNSYNQIPHSYYTMVDWALLRYFALTGDRLAKRTALRHLKWTLGHQWANGWIEHSAFTDRELPLTHNLSYTAQGLVESGKILRDEQLLLAAKRATFPLCEYFRHNDKIPALFDPKWKPAVRWECVTGNSQTAIVWRELGQALGDLDWTRWSARLLDRTLTYQKINSRIEAINGAMPGSWSINGGYDTLAFTNHAAKFFVDSLL
jgi:hypothetical protein